MKKIQLIPWFAAALAFLWPGAPASQAQNYLSIAGLSPYTQYQTFDTEHFHFVFQKGYLDFTQQAAMHLEHAHEILSPLLKWKPRLRTNILVADNQDDANGFTSPALRIGIVLIATPPDPYFSTQYTDNWIKLLVFHEYTHFLNIDPTTEWMEALRLFFGDIIKPNGLWPVWMLEGLAVYYETRTSKLGRGRSPYYDAILRAYLDEGRLGTRANRGMTLDRVNGDYPYFPGGDIPYLFGYHLWNQFAKDHTQTVDTDSAMGELSIRSSARVPYFIEGNLENVMRKTWQNYWHAFLKESETRLGNEIKNIRASGETPHELVTHTQYNASLGTISPSGEWLAYTQSSLDDETRLMLRNLKTQTEFKLEQKSLGLGMSFTPDSRYLIYSSLRRYKTFQYFSELLVYDLSTKQTKQITHGLRAKDPSVSPDGKHVTFIVSEGATHHLKIADLESKDGEFSVTHVRNAFQSPAFAILGTPRFINAREIVFSLQELDKPSSELMITTVEGMSRTLVNNGSMNRFPNFGVGRVYFCSDRTGVDNIYSVPLNGKDLRQHTNVITAANYPAVDANGTLWASLLTSDGFEIAKFSSTANIPASSKVGMPSAPSALTQALAAPHSTPAPSAVEDYSPWSSLWPRQWSPVSYLTYGQDAGLSLGATVLGFDTTGKHEYFGLAGYHFKSQTADGQFYYVYSGFRPLIDFEADSVTTDIASDTARSQYRRSSELSLGLSYPVRFTYSSLTPRVYGFTHWNQVYDLSSHQRISSPQNDFEYARPLIPGFGASLSFSDAESSRLGFMSERGNDARVGAEDRINPDHFSVLKYYAQYLHYFEVANHSVLVPQMRFLGSSYPTGFDRSFARLQGKDAQNIFDRGTGVNVNRIGIRGYSDGYHLARQVVTGSLDFHFPLSKIFSGFGTTPFFYRQLHGFIFGESTYIPGSRFRNLYLPAYGGGLSLDTTLLIRAPIRINLEIQNGTRKDFGGDTQVFFSLEGGSLF